MNWKEYEGEVFNYFRKKHSDANIKRNVKLWGKNSETHREIDILVEQEVLGYSFQIAVECKYWKSKLDVADISVFLDKLKDVGISRGVMVSTLGYSEAAYARAMKEGEIQLYVLDFENMQKYYGFWATAYRGNMGAIISAPNGWVVNNNVSKNSLDWKLCDIHPYQFTIEEASRRKQVAYFNIDTKEGNYSIRDLFKRQDLRVKEKDDEAKFKYWEDSYEIGKVTYRQIDYSSAGFNYVEFTGAIEVEDCIYYCVCAAPKNYVPDDLARLKYVMRELITIKLDGVDPSDSDTAWNDFHLGMM